MEQLQALEGKIHEMEAANKQLEEDKTVLLAQNHDYFERIQMLERQVAELSGAVLALSCSGTKRTSEIIEEHGRRVKRTKMITG